jgi:hypothetical protein
MMSKIDTFYLKVIINDCPIAVCVENPHKFWMCRQRRNVRQTSRQVSTTVGSATYRRYKSHSCYEAHSTTSPTPTAMGQSFIMTCTYDTSNTVDLLDFSNRT